MHVAYPIGRVTEHRKRDKAIYTPHSGQRQLYVRGVLCGLWLFPLEVLADDLCQRLSRGLDERRSDAEHVEEHEKRAELPQGDVQRDWLGGEGRREGFDAEGLVNVSGGLYQMWEW
jgi:hypothetical protein